VVFTASLAGSAAEASSLETESVAFLRAGLLLDGFDSVGAGTDLGTFAGFGAGIASAFLAFFATGAASGAPVHSR
jgi:hypothetical protein